MMIAAVAAPSDFAEAELKVKAGEVERHRLTPNRFEIARVALELLTQVTLQWNRLDEPRRDVLRHLASKLDEADADNVSWFKRTARAFRVMVYASRYGVDQMLREAHQLMDAVERFRCAVSTAEERNNEQLQTAIAEVIDSALTTPSTTRLSRGQVGEWLKRLPH